jgi:hypothetical protein
MEAFNIKTDQLAIEPKNSPTLGNVFIASPNKKAGTKLGVLFGLVSLENIAPDLADSFLEIIEDLQTEYYLPPLETENGVEGRFEEALQRANRRIGRLIQNSVDEIDLTNINTLVGLLHRDQLYLSQIGRTNAFLFHFKSGYHYSIIDIFDQSGTKRQKIDGEKMFSNVVSGEVSHLDQMFFSSDNILTHIAASELSEIVTSYDPIEAHKQIEADLTENDNQETFYSIIIKPGAEETKRGNAIVEADQEKKDGPDGIEDETEDEDDPDNSIKKLIKTQKETEEYLTPSLMPNWQKAIILLLVGIKKGIVITYLSTKKAIVKLMNMSKGLKKKEVKTVDNVPETPEAPETPEEPEITELVNDDEITSIDEPTPTDVTTSETNTPAPPEKGIFAVINKWLNNQLRKFFELKRLQQIMLIVFFIAIFLFSQSVVIIGKKGSVTETIDIQSIIDDARESINAAEAKNIFNDEKGAQESIKEAREYVSQIPDNKKYAEAKTIIEDKIAKLNRLLQKISYLENPATIANLSEKNNEANTNGLAKIGENIFTFDNQNHTLYKIDLIQKQTISLSLNEEIGNIKRIAPLDDNNLIILSNSNDFYRYQLAENVLEKVLVSDTTIADFGIYASKIYSLQSDKNQVFKHTKNSVGFSDGSAWITVGEITGGQSMSIDGGIFVGQNDGSIKYFLKGQEEATNIVVIDPPLGAIDQIVAGIDSDYIYVLDSANQRVVVFSKEGELQTQYTSKQFGDIKSIEVNEEKKLIYLLAGNKIYQIDIDF